MAFCLEMVSRVLPHCFVAAHLSSIRDLYFLFRVVLAAPSTNFSQDTHIHVTAILLASYDQGLQGSCAWEM